MFKTKIYCMDGAEIGTQRHAHRRNGVSVIGNPGSMQGECEQNR